MFIQHLQLTSEPPSTALHIPSGKGESRLAFLSQLPSLPPFSLSGFGHSLGPRQQQVKGRRGRAIASLTLILSVAEFR